MEETVKSISRADERVVDVVGYKLLWFGKGTTGTTLAPIVAALSSFPKHLVLTINCWIT